MKQLSPKRVSAFVYIVLSFFAMSLTSFSMAAAQQVISPVPQQIVNQYNLDTAWYNKYIDAWGVTILGSANIDNATLVRARQQLGTLLWTYPYWPVPELNNRNVRLVMLARGEVVSAIPEVYAMYGTSLDTRMWAGMGAAPWLPISVGTEANLMDNYGNENAYVHEFGHTLMDMSLAHIDPNFTTELNSAYQNAQQTGVWNNTYAITNEKEYWAEGLQSYFDVNKEGPQGGDGVHNHINTRVELQVADPQLYALLDRIFKGAILP